MGGAEAGGWDIQDQPKHKVGVGRWGTIWEELGRGEGWRWLTCTVHTRETLKELIKICFKESKEKETNLS